MRVGGDAAAWAAADAGALLDVPALTIAVGTDHPACDLFAPDEAAAERWEELVGRAPRACAVAALVVRRPSSLVTESLAYSLLQSGPEFRRWLEGRGPARPAGDAGDPRVRVDGRTIVLTRPGRHNALDVAMREALCDALDALAADDGPVTVRAEGPSFCSGGDLGEFGTAPEPVDAHFVRLARSPAARFQRLAGRLTVHLHGSCLGAGVELPAFAARVVAAPDTRIGLPEANIGLLPGAGGTVSIPARIGRRRFVELVVTGETIDARTALAWGLVDALEDGEDAAAK